VLHWPEFVHVWTPLFEQRDAPGAQTPVHAPVTHACPMHATPSCQVPVPLQICVVFPLHCVSFGTQVPEHAPPLQTLEQGSPSTNVPVASHVRGVVPLQVFVPGWHTPEHAPRTHACSLQATTVPHCPLAPHVCTPPEEHRLESGAHKPVHAPATHA
jgi:hypothetical protein